MESLARQCLECGRPLKGRIDKKFCDDACRNAYNNKQGAELSPAVRHVNNILKKNRKILQETLPAGEEKYTCSKQKLIQKGFDFVYHTHQHLTTKDTLYFFCYEYGYMNLDGDRVVIVKKKIV